MRKKTLLEAKKAQKDRNLNGRSLKDLMGGELWFEEKVFLKINIYYLFEKT